MVHARSELMEVLKIEPAHEAARVYLSQLAWRDGGREEARKQLEEAIAANPSSVEARMRLTECVSSRATRRVARICSIKRWALPPIARRRCIGPAKCSHKRAWQRRRWRASRKRALQDSTKHCSALRRCSSDSIGRRKRGSSRRPLRAPAWVDRGTAPAVAHRCAGRADRARSGARSLVGKHNRQTGRRARRRRVHARRQTSNTRNGRAAAAGTYCSGGKEVPVRTTA